METNDTPASKSTHACGRCLVWCRLHVQARATKLCRKALLRLQHLNAAACFSPWLAAGRSLEAQRKNDAAEEDREKLGKVWKEITDLNQPPDTAVDGGGDVGVDGGRAEKWQKRVPVSHICASRLCPDLLKVGRVSCAEDAPKSLAEQIREIRHIQQNGNDAEALDRVRLDLDERLEVAPLRPLHPAAAAAAALRFAPPPLPFCRLLRPRFILPFDKAAAVVAATARTLRAASRRLLLQRPGPSPRRAWCMGGVPVATVLPDLCCS